MAEAKEYWLSINCEGKDFQVKVADLETANLLLNEPKQKDNPTGEEIIWTRKKPTPKDIEATALLLSTRQKMNHLFDDKKTRKAKLWNDVANIFKDNNFNLSEKEGKHKVNPVNLEDSMEIDEDGNNHDQGVSQTTESDRENYANTEMVDENVPCGSSQYTQRFKKAKRTVTPSNKQGTLLKEIQIDRINRSREFGIFKEHLDKSREQKDRFLNILERAFGSKKRSRHSSDSD
ncbi:unnamed protein product [Psylliodes chrysocephalus]|uniref:Uncharacterized protein n=1 Tax=Psylliodes chrysocephalus TaxID=3402493 RepID=A0A9P0GM72_9CUCU|nr:unnamed protein product [Psylliodes chrysocephala]